MSAGPKRAAETHRLVLVHGARCTECGHEFTAEEFSEGKAKEWPVRATEGLVREPLIHHRGGPCEGRLMLRDVVRLGRCET